MLGGLFSISFAQAPATYYDGTAGLTGYALKSKLNVIISNGALDLGYGSGTGGLWETYFTSDRDKPVVHLEIKIKKIVQLNKNSYI